MYGLNFFFFLSFFQQKPAIRLAIMAAEETELDPGPVDTAGSEVLKIPKDCKVIFISGK